MHQLQAALLARGCAVDLRDGEGYTPLHNAAYSGEEEMVRILLERGARAVTRGGAAREIMKHVRNTRAIPINADLAIRRVAPGAPAGPACR